MNIDDVDQFGELRVELCNRRIGSGNDERHARNAWIVSWRYIERFDVIATRGEHAGHARQGTDLVLQED